MFIWKYFHDCLIRTAITLTWWLCVEYDKWMEYLRLFTITFFFSIFFFLSLKIRVMGCDWQSWCTIEHVNINLFAVALRGERNENLWAECRARACSKITAREQIMCVWSLPASKRAVLPKSDTSLHGWAEMKPSAISGGNLGTRVLHGAVPHVARSCPLVRGGGKLNGSV